MSDADIPVRIAHKMAAVIKTAMPKANVYPYWILGQGPIGESWPDMLSADEDEWAEINEAYVPWAHAYVIGFDEEASQRISNIKRRDTPVYRLWGFYGFLKGTIEKNSHDIALVHWRTVKNALTAALRFQQVGDSGVSEVEKHNEWQITQAGVYWMGEHNKCHIAQGEITVESSTLVPQVPITG